MSDMQEFSARAEERVHQGCDPMAALPAHEAKKIEPLHHAIDSTSYSLGEISQIHLLDPQASLALNSDCLVGSVNTIEATLEELELFIQDEVHQIQKAQKKIALWEERIEKNKVLIQGYLNKIKQNLNDVGYDKKNRDYWWNRADLVLQDYAYAEASGRLEDWAWMIKKYGLKNADGSSINEKMACVGELCNGAASNLANEYRIAGNKYETDRKRREAENIQMIEENGRLTTSNQELQHFISRVYSQEIEPLQDGVLLYKELDVKLKALGQEGNRASYGELRSWAESFLDEFLKANPRVLQHVVTEFRRLASIPLPVKNS